MVALALVSGSTCEARIEAPEFDGFIYVGKYHTTKKHVKKKVGLCPTGLPTF